MCFSSLYNSSSHIAQLKSAINFEKIPNSTGVLFGFHIALQKYFIKKYLENINIWTVIIRQIQQEKLSRLSF